MSDLFIVHAEGVPCIFLPFWIQAPKSKTIIDAIKKYEIAVLDIMDQASHTKQCDNT